MFPLNQGMHVAYFRSSYIHELVMYAENVSGRGIVFVTSIVVLPKALEGFLCWRGCAIRMILVHYSFAASLLLGFLPFFLPFSL
jgi:hypothetical protein